MQGFYHHFIHMLLGGGIDLFNDRVSALLVDTSIYVPDLSENKTIDDIPENSIVSETVVSGWFYDNLTMHCDDLTFNSVDVTDQTISGIVLFRDATTITESYLIGIFDSENFPLVATGTDIVVSMPSSGIIVMSI